VPLGLLRSVCPYFHLLQYQNNHVNLIHSQGGSSPPWICIYYRKKIHVKTLSKKPLVVFVPSLLVGAFKTIILLSRFSGWLIDTPAVSSMGSRHRQSVRGLVDLFAALAIRSCQYRLVRGVSMSPGLVPAVSSSSFAHPPPRSPSPSPRSPSPLGYLPSPSCSPHPASSSPRHPCRLPRPPGHLPRSGRRHSVRCSL